MSLRVAAVEFVPSWLQAPEETSAPGPVAPPVKKKSLTEVVNAQEFVPSWLSPTGTPASVPSDTPGVSATNGVPMLEQSIVDNALSTSAQPVAVATEKPVPAETTPSQTEEPQRGGGAHTSEEQDEDADAASKAAPADSNDAGHHAPLQELPKKDPQDVPNYDVPEDGAERRRWPMDFMKAQREMCKFRPDGMEDSPPGCGYELGDGNSSGRSGSQNRNKGRREGGGRGGNKKNESNVHVAPLVQTENRWTRVKDPEALAAEDQVVKKIRGILNKLTSANFDRLFEQIIDCGITTVHILSGVIDLVYEKAVTEHTFSEMYAKLCASLCEKMPEFTEDEQTQTFKSILLRKCQKEFQNRNKLPETDKAETDKAETDKAETDKAEPSAAAADGEEPTEGAPKKEEEAQDPEMLEIQRKKRVLGNIKFVGELYKKTLLNEGIMHSCIQTLFGSPQNLPPEEELEGMTKLLSTIGKTLDNGESKQLMDMYMTRCIQIAKGGEACYRVKFMLQDLVELRQRGWEMREIEKKQNKAVTAKEKEDAAKDSKKKQEQKKKEKEQKKKEEQKKKAEKSKARNAPAVDDGWAVAGNAKPTPQKKGGKKGQQATPTKVEALPTKPAKPVTKQSMFALLGGGDSSEESEEDEDDDDDEAEEEEEGSEEDDEDAADDDDEHDDEDAKPSQVSEEELTRKTKSLLSEFLSGEDISEAVLCIQELNAPSFHSQVVYRIVTTVLEKKERQRQLAVQLVARLCTDSVVTSTQLTSGFEEVGSLLEDLEIDIPFASKLVLAMMGELIAQGHLRFGFVSTMLPFLAPPKVPELIAHLLDSVVKEVGQEQASTLYKADQSSFDLSSLDLSAETLEKYSVIASMA